MSKAAVLTVYNAYLNRGGEDEVFEAESDLLEQQGHHVTRFRVEADELRTSSTTEKARLAAATVWSSRYHREFRDLVRTLRPNVVHFHNTFPLLSPSVYSACHEEGAAVVQTLHNYRLVCPATVLYRDGHVCTDCVGKSVAWPSVRHACYHESKSQTAVVATMLAANRARGTWRRDVDLYVTPTAFARERFIEGGLDAARILVKPNFVRDQGRSREPGDAFLYVGRLAEHKGVPALLNAWRLLPDDVALRLIGDGPLAPEVESFAASRPNVSYLGRQPHEVVVDEMCRARALIFASTWYETFGLTIAEAYSCGLPVLASDIGATGSEMVRDGVTGRLFKPGDGASLAEAVRWSVEHCDELATMGLNARLEYEAKYTAMENYRQLTSIYDRVMGAAASVPAPFPDLRRHTAPRA